MTREEALHWWRQGYESGILAAQRATDTRGGAGHTNAIREFHAARRADQQAKADALLEAIDVLAPGHARRPPGRAPQPGSIRGTTMAVTGIHTPALARMPVNWPPRPGRSPIARSASPSAAGRAITSAASLSLAGVLAPGPVHGHGRTLKASESKPLLSVAASQDVSVPVPASAPIRTARASPGAYPSAEVGTCAGIGVGTETSLAFRSAEQVAFAALKAAGGEEPRCQTV
jgi:hypothetical protein